MNERLVIGCMTGTSIDAVDAALVRVEGHGPHMRAMLEDFASEPLAPIGEELRAVAEQASTTAERLAFLARELALLHVDAIRKLDGHEHAVLTAVHGQTVFHRPPLSLQLINASVIAHALRCPVIHDLRAADLAAGGQGAPITPLADWVLFRSDEEPRVVANLGGFCNITVLPRETASAGHVTGRDICPCNHLLDRIARRCFGAPFDTDGARALAGTRSDAVFHDLTERLRQTSHDGRSLGTGDEFEHWIDDSLRDAAPDDLAATACAAIGATLGRHHPGMPTHLLLAGGGTRNLALLDAIRDHWAGPVSYTDQVGIPAEAREAVCMAVLGAISEDRDPITLERTTGVPRPPIAGAIVHP